MPERNLQRGARIIDISRRGDTEEYTRSVLLNSAAGQALGHAFLTAAKDIDAHEYLVMLSSGAASLVGAGWSSYGAGKAAIDQWVRPREAVRLRLRRGGAGACCGHETGTSIRRVRSDRGS